MHGFEGYWHIAIMIGIAVVIAATMVAVSFLFGPRNPNPHKSQPYECGIEEIVPLPRRVSIKFLQVAMLFLIFDVEAVAFYPLATILRHASGQAGGEAVFLLGEMLTFAVVLLVGYLYVLRKGALRWTA